MPTQDRASSGASRLTAADVMTRNPRTCSTYSTVLEAVLIFRDADCGAVPVLEDGAPIGILTDRDVALALARFDDLPQRPVSDVMTRGVVAVAPDTPLERVEQIFGQEGIRRVLVTQGKEPDLVGIIAWADLSARVSDTEVGEVVSDVVEQP